MTGYEEVDYAHAVARVRSLETGLLRPADLERLLEAPSIQEAWKLARELVGIAENTPVSEFETTLGQELARFFAYVASFLPDRSVPNWFYMRHDYHNLKVLMKELWLGEPADTGAYSLVGNYPVEELRRQVLLMDPPGAEDDPEVPSPWRGRLPRPYRTAMAAARSAWESSADPQAIDVVLDRFLFEALEVEARKLGPTIHRVSQCLVDLANLKVLLRSGRLGKNRAFLRLAVLPGGSIPAPRWLDLLGASVDRIAQVAGEPYAAMLYAANGDPGTVERLGDNYVTAVLKEARYVAMGREPVLALLWAKDNDIRNLRIVLSGKLNGVPAPAIRERLRDSYV